MITSPRLIPMRNSMRHSCVTPSLRSHRAAIRLRIDHAGKLDQEPVAGGLDDAPAILGNLGSVSSPLIAFSAASVPSSSSPISRE
jgi:hypothetical protein